MIRYYVYGDCVSAGNGFVLAGVGLTSSVAVGGGAWEPLVTPTRGGVASTPLAPPMLAWEVSLRGCTTCSPPLSSTSWSPRISAPTCMWSGDTQVGEEGCEVGGEGVGCALEEGRGVGKLEMGGRWTVLRGVCAALSSLNGLVMVEGACVSLAVLPVQCRVTSLALCTLAGHTWRVRLSRRLLLFCVLC